MTEREIFLEALEMGTPEARAAYLEGACARDGDLRRNVEELLKEHFSNDSLLLGGAALKTEWTEVEPHEAPGPMLDRYKLLEKIGEGGFGEVWMAEQREPIKRHVALKIIKPGMDSRQIVARFEAERQALAMMDHANIAKVFDAGTTDSGRLYFVMELVHGIKITEYCDQNHLPTQERLRLFILVCHAIQHAHQKGIIHRDIKPSNILVTLRDGPAAAGCPKVIDFGIAKATQQELTDKTVFTQFQQFIGTPAYISPEQAQMSGLDIDTRADIYSLGVLLYELLVGQTPFDKEMMQGGLDALRQVIREREPVRPSTRLNTLQGDARTTAGQRRQTEVGKLVHQLQGDLDWIVMKCLEKDRTRRYDTANGLAADLSRHLNNELVVARPPTAAYRFQKAFRRNKLVFAAGATIVVALVLGVIGTTIGLLRAEKQRQVAETARLQEAALRLRVESAERETQQQLHAALLEQARAVVRSGELGHRVRALDALRRAAAISNTVELRREAFAALALPDLRLERELPTGPVTLVYLDPAFERVAIARERGPVEIRSVPDDRLVASLPASTDRPAHLGRWSPDGRFLAVKRDHDATGLRADWEVWEVSSARRVLLLQNMWRDMASFHPSLPQIATVRGDREVMVHNLDDGTGQTRLTLPYPPFQLAYSPDGERFAVAGDQEGQCSISVHAAGAGSDVPRLRSPFISYAVASLDWDPRGRWLAAGVANGAVNLMDLQTGEFRTLGHHKGVVVEMKFSPDGHYLVSGGWEGELIFWDLQTMRRAFTVPLNSYRLQFRADGRACGIVTGTERQLQLHTFEQPTAHREFAENLGGRMDHAAFSDTGRWLAASADERLGVWDLNSRGPAAVASEAAEARLFFAPDGRELFASRGQEDGFRWRITPNKNPEAAPQLEPLGFPKPEGFTSLCLISNTVALTGSQGTRLVPLENAAAVNGPWTRTAPGRSCISPDGKWLGICRSFSRSLYVHSLPGLEQVAKLSHSANINFFRFSPLDDEVALMSRRSVEFWSTATWQRTRTLTNFMGVLYPPDARTLWLTKDPLTAGLYDARTVAPLLPLPAGMVPLAISPDGRRLAVCVDARRLQLWDMLEVRKQLRELGMDWSNDPSEVSTPKR
jgi:WD40 repeat protein/tRNA A-37 threonylcarbamoyl transferase component Bud32